MKCPACATIDLAMSERSGIEIDYCPQCRGVWLDRGELDKIIERSNAIPDSERAPVGKAMDSHAHPWGKSEHHTDHRQYSERGHPHHHKKSFWQELFD